MASAWARSACSAAAAWACRAASMAATVPGQRLGRGLLLLAGRFEGGEPAPELLGEGLLGREGSLLLARRLADLLHALGLGPERLFLGLGARLGSGRRLADGGLQRGAPLGQRPLRLGQALRRALGCLGVARLDHAEPAFERAEARLHRRCQCGDPLFQQTGTAWGEAPRPPAGR
jgi:hypothetical protein